MCFFISLVTKGGDARDIDRLLRDHGRQARRYENASARAFLGEDECLFLTTVEHCDCGTVLASKETDGASDDSVVSRQVGKLEKKGWSSTKIQRWIEDRSKAGERRGADAPDSFALWSDIISGLIALKGVQNAGLLLHFYSGSPETEVLALTRTVVQAGEFASRLRRIGEDHVLMARA